MVWWWHLTGTQTHTRVSLWFIISEANKQSIISRSKGLYHICWINVRRFIRSLHGALHKVIGPHLVRWSYRNCGLRLSLMHGALRWRRSLNLRHGICEKCSKLISEDLSFAMDLLSWRAWCIGQPCGGTLLPN